MSGLTHRNFISNYSFLIKSYDSQGDDSSFKIIGNDQDKQFWYNMEKVSPHFSFRAQTNRAMVGELPVLSVHFIIINGTCPHTSASSSFFSITPMQSSRTGLWGTFLACPWRWKGQSSLRECVDTKPLLSPHFTFSLWALSHLASFLFTCLLVSPAAFHF
jgi:hypothetical protein